ncbi:hypothetical protein D3C81_920530 [compost metagenome]
MQPAQPVGQCRQALVQDMGAALPCLAQATSGPGKVTPTLACRYGGNQHIRTRLRLQRKAHGTRQFQVQPAAQQGFGPGIDHMPEHQHGIACQCPALGGSRRPPAERHDLATFGHLQLHPRVILHEQGIEAALMVVQRGAASGWQADDQYPQLKGHRRAQGDTQLGRTQDGQQVGTAAVIALHYQQTECPDVFGATGSNQQPLNQQLQRSALRLGHMAQQTLKHLLVDIVHRLVVNSTHVITSSTSCIHYTANCTLRNASTLKNFLTNLGK